MSDASHTTSFRGAVLRAAALNSVVAVAAATLSFHALADLASMTGVFPGWLPILWPLVVDVFMLQASLSLVASAGAHDHHARRYHWTMLAVWSTVSLVANFYHAIVVAHGVLPAVVSASIAVVPPLALLASTHGLIVHLAHTPTSHTSACGAHPQVPAVHADERELPTEPHDELDEHDENGGEGSHSEPVPTMHRPDPTAVEVTDEHVRLALRVKSQRRIKTTEHDVALVIALADAGYSAKDIANLRPDIGVRTTISRWLGTADYFRADTDSRDPVSV